MSVDPFAIDIRPVTNCQFAAFVKATGYRTLAQRFGRKVLKGGRGLSSTRSSD